MLYTDVYVCYLVPTELRKVELTMKGRVFAGSRKSFEKLSNVNIFAVNAVDDTSALGQCCLLPRKNEFSRFSSKKETFFYNYVILHHENSWILEVRGKNGESLGRQNVKVFLTHRYFKQALDYNLSSTDKGEINLGPLPDVSHVEVVATDESIFGSKRNRIKVRKYSYFS